MVTEGKRGQLVIIFSVRFEKKMYLMTWGLLFLTALRLKKVKGQVG